MGNTLFDLLVNKSNDCRKEIARLEKFRGLTTATDENNLNSFLEHYFSKDSVNNYSVVYLGHWNKWTKSFASNMIQGEHVDPLDLEPFVARYVTAINKAGVQTFWSCDGWHKDSEHVLKIGFKERYSLIWHKIICSFLTDNHGISWRYDGVFAILDLPKTDKGKIEKYISLNQNADAIELLQSKMLEIKRKLISKAKNKVKNSLTDEEVEEYMNNLVNEILQEQKQ